MTCVVGLEDDGHVYLGADSAAVAGYDLRITRHPKCFRNVAEPRILFGYTTSFRFGQILQYGFKPPVRNPDHTVYADDMHYLCTDFVDALRECLQTHGWLRTAEDNSSEGGFALIAYRNHLYRLEEDFHIQRPSGGYSAIGCGEPYAQAILHHMRTKKTMCPYKKMTYALDTASSLSAGVSPPYHFVETYD